MRQRHGWQDEFSGRSFTRLCRSPRYGTFDTLNLRIFSLTLISRNPVLRNCYGIDIIHNNYCWSIQSMEESNDD